MNILHLTDLHYFDKGKDPSKVINAIITKIKEENIAIDFVFFTGDIVNIGADDAQYSKAVNLLFGALQSELNVDASNIIICPGNHDIDRSKISKSLKSYFNTDINDNLSLNKFYKSKDNDFQNSLSPLTPYRNFANSFYNEGAENELCDIYSLHYRQFQNKRIAILGLYTPWLSALFGGEVKGIY